MRLALRIAFLLLLLPAAEVLAFLLVARGIGFLPALGLMLLTSLAGGVALRHVGRARSGQFGRGRRGRNVRAGAAEAGGLIALAGILLLLPGFITDLMGAALLVAPVRRWFAGRLGGLFAPKPRADGAVTVIDLEPGEWRAIPDRRARRSRRPTAKAEFAGHPASCGHPCGSAAPVLATPPSGVIRPRDVRSGQARFAVKPRQIKHLVHFRGRRQHPCRCRPRPMAARRLRRRRRSRNST